MRPLATCSSLGPAPFGDIPMSPTESTPVSRACSLPRRRGIARCGAPRASGHRGRRMLAPVVLATSAVAITGAALKNVDASPRSW